MSALSKALAISCPYCGSGPTFPCVASDGQALTRIHRARKSPPFEWGDDSYTTKAKCEAAIVASLSDDWINSDNPEITQGDRTFGIRLTVELVEL